MLCNTNVFASSMTFEEAKNYLQNYEATKVNELGKEYTIKYIFKSEEDLNKTASYISENGLTKFNTTMEEKIAEAVKNESNELPQTRSTDPIGVYRTVSGNGPHSVSGISYGLASFGNLGTVEYQVHLGYIVTVQNGRMTSVSNISFDIPYISAMGSWGDTSFPSYCNSTICGVTANYTITKTLFIEDIGIAAETDFETFSLITNLG